MRALWRKLPLTETVRGRDAWGAVLLVVAIVTVVLSTDSAEALATADFAAAVLASGALAWRRDAPVWVLAGAVALFAVATALSESVSLAFVPLVVAVYSAAAWTRSVRIALESVLAAWALSVVAVAWGSVATSELVISAGAWLGAAGAIGVAAQLYRAGVEKERERALRAEEAQDALAQQRVAQERLRIARDLHDAVGHHVAVMTVQAGLAQHLLGSDPDKAGEALERVHEAGARVMDELPVMLRVLRQDGDEDSRPAPGVALVPDLVADARQAGLDVTYEPESLPGLSTATDMAAYRVVQEALTNARKYGVGAAALRVAMEDGAVVVEVRNHVAQRADARDGSGAGWGLVGMRERVGAADGSVEVGRDGEEFVVRAVLPVRTAPLSEGETA
ncbi:histidine kinase [Demequina sp. B12]|uniref:sensor histidine kinase n=1 Tax=Demequina sp. B12 TaxID=2992757 RepID=UPI00237A3DC4|nr:histidine kinase [Demequina sp. B12]MDE0573628.1 histidine kinase [Demequina sp. B12]